MATGSATILDGKDAVVANAVVYTPRPAYVLPAERGILVLPAPLSVAGPLRLPL